MIKYLLVLFILELASALIIGYMTGVVVLFIEKIGFYKVFGVSSQFIHDIRYVVGVALTGVGIAILAAKKIYKARIQEKGSQGANAWHCKSVRSPFSNDPLQVGDKDLLSRDSIEEMLASNMVSCHSNEQSGRIALWGDWGSGKTSVLNRAIGKVSHMKDSPVIVNFNAWRYVNRDDVVTVLYTEVARECFNAGKYRLACAYLMLGIRSTSFMSIQHEGPGNFLMHVCTWIAIIFCNGADEIRKIFDKDIHTVVVIDDLDRLPQSQIRNVLYAICAAGNLPGVNYVVPSDRKAIMAAFNTECSGCGQAYIERIFTTQLFLPEVEPSLYVLLLSDALKKLYSEHGFDFKGEQMDKMPLVIRRVKTYRGMVRLYNEVSLRLKSRLCEAELTEAPYHLGDLIELSALRLVEPEVYENVYRHKFLFLDRTTFGTTPKRFTFDDLKMFIAPHIPNGDSRMDDIIRFLENHLAVRKNENGEYECRADDKIVDHELRLSSMRCFATYFESYPGEMAIYKAYQKEFLDAIVQGEESALACLLKFDSQAWLSSFLFHFANEVLRLRKDETILATCVNVLMRLQDEKLASLDYRDIKPSFSWTRNTPYHLASVLMLRCIDHMSEKTIVKSVIKCISEHYLNSAVTFLTVGMKSSDGQFNEYELPEDVYHKLLLSWLKDMRERTSLCQKTNDQLPNENELLDHWRLECYEIREGRFKDVEELKPYGDDAVNYFAARITDAESARKILADSEGFLDENICPRYFKPIGFARLRSSVGNNGIKKIRDLLGNSELAKEIGIQATIFVLEDYLRDVENPKEAKEQAYLVKDRFETGDQSDAS